MSNNRLVLRLAAALLAGSALAAPATARTYCCTDKDGHKICGDTMPPQCEDRAYKEFGEKGKIRTIEAPLTPEQKAQREAEAARKKETEQAAADQRRMDRALLNTYSSEKDIDAQRDRAVADLGVAVKQAQNKYDAAAKNKQRLDKELEFYAKKPVPATLKSQIKEAEVEMAAQQKALDDKKKEIDAKRAKFEEDRKRYRELTSDTKPSAAAVDARPR